MSNPNLISYEEVCDVYEHRKRINQVNFKDLILMKDCKEFVIPKELREELKFTGLNTIDLILMSVEELENKK
jgi:hypothetical protein